MQLERTTQDAQEERLKDSLRRALGTKLIAALENPAIIDIMLNPDGKVWYEEFRKGRYDSGIRFLPSQADTIFRQIAGFMNVTVTAEKPILEAELPLDGSRFAGVIPPIVTAPTFTIRKHPPEIFKLETYRDSGILTHKDDPANVKAHRVDDFVTICQGLDHYAVLCKAIEQRKTIIVLGGTGSGKTNLANALLDYSSRVHDARYLLMEDTRELRTTAANSVILRTSVNVDLSMLLRVVLRFSPDQIIVGEVRGGEILALFKAWLTGHPGVATLHANNIDDAFVRMESMQREAGIVPDPIMIAKAVNLIVDIDREPRNPSGRKVRGIAVVSGYDSISKQYQYQYL